jgi:hypothetical protein
VLLCIRAERLGHCVSFEKELRVVCAEKKFSPAQQGIIYYLFPSSQCLLCHGLHSRGMHSALFFPQSLLLSALWKRHNGILARSFWFAITVIEYTMSFGEKQERRSARAAAPAGRTNSESRSSYLVRCGFGFVHSVPRILSNLS